MANPSLGNVAGYRELIAQIASDLAAAVVTHVAQSDPHSQYQKESEKGAVSGYASLDSGGTIPDAQIPAAIARDTEITTAVNNHTAASDPHTQYQKESEKDTALGYAGLNSSGRTTKGVDTTDDLIVDTDTKGLVLKDNAGSPHYWRLTVSALGILAVTDLGTTKP